MIDVDFFQPWLCLLMKWLCLQLTLAVFFNVSESANNRQSFTLIKKTARVDRNQCGSLYVQLINY